MFLLFLTYTIEKCFELKNKPYTYTIISYFILGHISIIIVVLIFILVITVHITLPPSLSLYVSLSVNPPNRGRWPLTQSPVLFEISACLK